MIKIIKVEENKVSGLDITVDIDKEKLYPFLKSLYNKKEEVKINRKIYNRGYFKL